MARNETEKEDLLAEGVNLPERGRITSPNHREWVAGWRNGQSLSLFVDQDPVFHFNASGEIRRAYVDGRKLTAKDAELFELVRVPNESGRVSLVHQPLTEEETGHFQALLNRCLNELNDALNLCGDQSSPSHHIETIGIETTQFRHRLAEWIDTHPAPMRIAELPNVD